MRIELPSPDQIPQCLRDLPQWVCWKFIERAGKRTKCPVNPRFGWNASATDPKSWGTLDEALAACRRSDTYAGIGFVFSEGDQFCGIDLDNCFDDAGNFTWGRDIIDALATYTEVSPSGHGVKLFLKAKKPEFARCRRTGFGPEGRGEIEIYDRARFFAVTCKAVAGTPHDVMERQQELETLCAKLWPQKADQPVAAPPPDDRRSRCLQSVLRMQLIDQNDGSFRLFAACCRCVEHDLTDAEALTCVHEYSTCRPFPTPWTDEEVVRRLRDAEATCERGVALERGVGPCLPAALSVRELLAHYPELRKTVLHGLLREGETMNVISAPKVGKSWLVTDLALAIATGRPWLDCFPTVQGNVLIIDNELHGETSANRIPKVAAARGIPLDVIGDAIYVENLRGRLQDIFSLRPYFEAIPPGRFKVVVIDAFYRVLPRDSDENDNGTMAQIYNHIDCFAHRLGCSFVLIHHSSKGNQSGKSVTDVGAGAGSQARATDTHLILRPHEEDDCAVLDAAVRSWPPIEPRGLRWTFPVWNLDDALDPAALRPERPRRRSKADGEPKTSNGTTEAAWDAPRFATTFVDATPAPTLALVQAALNAGLSERKATRLLKQAESQGLVYRWRFGATHPVQFATVPQPETPA